jgi:hypothetical protein
MNIFYLDNSPRLCAEQHCDKHVVKMILEYAQLLSTAHRVLDGVVSTGISKTGRKQTSYVLSDSREPVLYRATHLNHPSAVWVRQSSANYEWLYVMWLELMSEYTHRYHKQHACEKLVTQLRELPHNITQGTFTEPPPAMPDYCKVSGDSIRSYRNYYIQEKARFAKWKTKTPEWFLVA